MRVRSPCRWLSSSPHHKVFTATYFFALFCFEQSVLRTLKHQEHSFVRPDCSRGGGRASTKHTPCSRANVGAVFDLSSLSGFRTPDLAACFVGAIHSATTTWLTHFFFITSFTKSLKPL